MQGQPIQEKAGENQKGNDRYWTINCFSGPIRGVANVLFIFPSLKGFLVTLHSQKDTHKK